MPVRLFDVFHRRNPNVLQDREVQRLRERLAAQTEELERLQTLLVRLSERMTSYYASRTDPIPCSVLTQFFPSGHGWQCLPQAVQVSIIYSPGHVFFLF